MAEKIEALKLADRSPNLTTPVVAEPNETGHENGEAIHYMKGFRLRLIISASVLLQTQKESC